MVLSFVQYRASHVSKFNEEILWGMGRGLLLYFNTFYFVLYHALIKSLIAHHCTEIVLSLPGAWLGPGKWGA